MDKLYTLRAAAEKVADRGPWTYRFPMVNGIELRGTDCQVGCRGFLIANVSHGAGPIDFGRPDAGADTRENNARHIALFCPQTAIALIGCADALRKALPKLRNEPEYNAAKYALAALDTLDAPPTTKETP